MGVFAKLGRWIGHMFRRMTDKASTRYYEGPTPPLRLIEAVEAFVVMCPNATQEQWVRFAAGHAGESYKSGYIRGVEWKERAAEQMEPSSAWAVIDSDERKNDWTWADFAPTEEQLSKVVQTHSQQIESLSPEERLLYEDMIGQQFGTHRIALIPIDDPKQR